MKLRPWIPLIPPSLTDQAWQFVENAESCLPALYLRLSQSNQIEVVTEGVAAGLFARYLSREKNSQALRRTSEDFLSLTYDANEKFGLGDSLVSGIAGIGWVSEHFCNLEKKRWIHGDPHEYFDDYLLKKIKKAIRTKSSIGYGLLDYWVGYGAYALERYPRGKSSEILAALVRFFDLTKHEKPGGVAWFNSLKTMIPALRKILKRGHYALDLAHGNPGVLDFLTRTLEKNILPTTTRRLLEESLRWILSMDDGNPYTSSDRREGRKSRLAWCNGDLGMAPVLLRASSILEDASQHTHSLEIARRAAKCSVRRSRVDDPFVCHGASGNFHIFGRLYQLTGDSLFLDAAHKWAGEIFPYFDKKIFRENSGDTLFDGKTGVALSLLAGLSRVSPDWDRFLFIS